MKLASKSAVVAALLKKDPDYGGLSRGAKYLDKIFWGNNDAGFVFTVLHIAIAEYYDASELRDSKMQILADMWEARDPEEFHAITGYPIGVFR